MEQPEGHEVSGREKLVCKLKHSIYGLKQALRCWKYYSQPMTKRIGIYANG